MIEFIPNTLLADALVTGIVGNKIKPVGSNQGDTFPYVTFQVVSDVPERCKEGVAQEEIRVQVSAYALTYGQCQALYKAVKDALDGAQDSRSRCKWLSAQDMYRDEASAHGKAIDFQLITKG